LKAVIDQICNLKAMSTYLQANMNFNSARTPLGALSKAQIKAGFEVLSKIEKCLSENNFGEEHEELVNAYLTRIPHAFGFKRISFLQTPNELKQELELLEALSGAELANELLEEDKPSVKIVNPSDRNYERLNCEMVPLDETSSEYKLIETYLTNTHGVTHDDYKLKLVNVLKIERRGEGDGFRSDLPNQHLLWHGSPVTNWVGILLKGLRIAPPEAPVTGYMFGKGVYGANSISKSANYCRSRDRGFLTLAQFALGEMQKRTEFDYDASTLPDGIHSTHGVGEYEPLKKGEKKIILDGQEVIVPCGKLTKKKNFNGSLKYDEFIVYHQNQTLLRFLVEVEFIYS